MTGCVGAELLGRGPDWLEARLQLARAGIRQTLVTHNRLRPPESMIIDQLEGPFRRFHGEWTFTPLADAACKVEFWLEYEFSSRLLELAAGGLFEQVASEQVAALCRRARQVYGPGEPQP